MSLSIEQKLPAELLDHTVSYSPRESLRSLCLASKTLNRLATPKLYSSIYLRETDHLPALTYLMLTSPAHAALVKSFTVPRTWAETNQNFCVWSWPRRDDPKLHGVLEKKCAEYTASEDGAEELYAKIRSGENEDVILALLLASLPNLGRLNHNFSVGLRHEDFVVFWPKIISGIKARRESFAKHTRSLTSSAEMHTVPEPIDVLVTGTDDKESGYTAHLAVFFHMPNLRSIYAWMHGDHETPDPDTPFAKLRPRSWPVEYVELRSAKLDA